jgi:flagellar motor switch/type III secretory pathway protein FliN
MDWLPPSTLADARVRKVFSNEVGRWNERWFGGRLELSIGEFLPATAARRSIPTNGDWRAIGSGVACHWNDKQASVLAQYVLDADQSQHQIAGVDGELLLSVADDVMADLASALGKATGLSKDSVFESGVFERYGGLLIVLNTPKKAEPQLKLAIPVAAAAAVRKSVVARPPLPEPLEGRLTDVFDKEEVAVAVHLGEATLSAQSLWGLAPGDVIVLEKDMDEAFPMVSAQNGERICALQLTREEGANALLVVGK